MASIDSKATRRACVFCRRIGPLTNEHVLPTWLHDVIPGEGKLVHEWIAPEGSNAESREWTARFMDFKAKVVCESCNTGWMHDLEESARPFLKSMIRGYGRTLYAGGREQVAHWALKTVMMLDFAQEPAHRSVPVADYPALYEAKGVLPNTFVWLAACDFGPSADARHRTLQIDDAHFGGFGATLKIGYLVIEVIRVEIEDGKTLKVGGQLTPALRRLWPKNKPVSWPPVAQLTRQQVIFLGDIIEAGSLLIASTEIDHA